MQIPTFRDPRLSLLQSALHRTLERRGEPNTDNLSVLHPAMQALVLAGLQATSPGQTFSPGDIPEDIARCVRLFEDYVRGRIDLVILFDELKGSSCDPFWLEMFFEYLQLVALGGVVQYREYDLHMRPNSPILLQGDTVSIALLADWGMGTGLAANVLAQAVTSLPAGSAGEPQPAASMLIHMGDIYYAGTIRECYSHFVEKVRGIKGDAVKTRFPVYAVPGNHEYYSGAVGFYGVVLPETAGQTNSFFCLRTGQWQIVALDTGYNDRNPFTEIRNVTFLTPDQEAWLKTVMDTAENRRTILLTHHQLYSAVLGVGHRGKVRYGINPDLYAQIKPYFGQIAVWLWGHEHNTVIFNPQEGVPLGRCIGSASVPMMVADNPYTPAVGLAGVDGIAVPSMDLSVQLSNNGTDYAHGFAVLSLSPDQAAVNYYEVPLPTLHQTGPSQASWMWGESFPASPAAAPAPRDPAAAQASA